MELGKNAYIKQSILFLQNNDFEDSYRVGKEFLGKFPDEMFAHFVVAKSAYWLGKFDESALEARKAFNLSATGEDMARCTILAASAYYELGEIGKGLEMLNAAAKAGPREDLETLLVIFCLAGKDEKGAFAHLQALYSMNKEAAAEVAIKLLKRSE